MKILRLTALPAVFAVLFSSSALAQTNAAMLATNLIPLRFTARARLVDTNRARFTSRRVTERDLIARSLGLTNRGSASLISNYVVVYNSTADKIQVVDLSTAQPVADVFTFQGGAFASDLTISTRFTYMFLPNGTTPIGSVIINEFAADSASTLAGRLPFIRGDMQFALTPELLLGSTPLETNLVTPAPVTGLNPGNSATNGPGAITPPLAPSNPVTNISVTTPGSVGGTPGGTALGGSSNAVVGGGTAISTPGTSSNQIPGILFPPLPGSSTPVVSAPGGTNSVPGLTNNLPLGPTSLVSPQAALANTTIFPLEGFELGGVNGPFFLTTSPLQAAGTDDVRIFTGHFETDRKFQQ